MTFYVYKITNIINDKFYIGRTNDYKNRFRSHISDALSFRLNTYFCKAIRKYGRENFIMEIIEEVKTKKEVIELEIYWIRLHKYLHPEMYYNLTDGGEGGSDYKMSQEIKDKLSQDRLGDKNPRFNIPVSIDTKIKMVESQSKRKPRMPLTDEQKQKNLINQLNKNPGIIISSNIKEEIRQLFSTNNYTKKDLATKFGLTYNNIVYILKKKKIIVKTPRIYTKLTEETKLKIRNTVANQDRSIKIDLKIKNNIIELFKTGKFTKRQLSKQFNISFASIQNIIAKYRTKLRSIAN